MTETSNPYVFTEANPKAISVHDNPRALIKLAIEQLTEQHAMSTYWDTADQRAIAALQAALYHLSYDNAD